MAEGCENVIEGCTPARIRNGTGQHQSQVTQVGLCLLEFGKAADAHYGGDGVMVPRHYHVSTALRIGHETCHASLRGFRDTDLMWVAQHSHDRTI